MAASGAPKREDDIINGAILGPAHAYGFRSDPIQKNASFVSDDTIVYPTGRHLASLDLVNRRMDFFKREEPFASEVTALGVGVSRKKELVLGLAERTANGYPRALIYIP